METLLALLATALLLFSATASNTENRPVLDINGDQVQADTDYHVISAIWGAGGGGVTLRPIESGSTCPLFVAQEASDLFPGLPVKFHPSNPDDRTIRTDTDLNVEFYANTLCSESTVWRVGAYRPGDFRQFIRTGGTVGDLGPQTAANWFKIEQTGGSLNDYKLVHCSSGSRLPCRDVGILEFEGRYLGLTDNPFRFILRKVEQQVMANKRDS